MLDCIHAGATDYLLKPLYSNVIKTLFLASRPENSFFIYFYVLTFFFFLQNVEITFMSTTTRNHI